MDGIRDETYLYTREQVEDHLDDAYQCVLKMNLPAHLEVIAYRCAIELLSRKHVQVQAAMPAGILLPQGPGANRDLAG